MKDPGDKIFVVPDAVLERLGKGDREAGIGLLDGFMEVAPHEGGDYEIWPCDVEHCGKGSKRRGFKLLNRLFKDHS